MADATKRGGVNPAINPTGSSPTEDGVPEVAAISQQRAAARLALSSVEVPPELRPSQSVIAALAERKSWPDDIAKSTREAIEALSRHTAIEALKPSDNAIAATLASHTIRSLIEGEAELSSVTKPAGGYQQRAEAPANPETVIPAMMAKSRRRAAVDEFLLRCNQEPDLSTKVLRKHIWKAVGHSRPRQFQYWQNGSDKATDADEKNFSRIVCGPPAKFIGILKTKRLVPPSL